MVNLSHGRWRVFCFEVIIVLAAFIAGRYSTILASGHGVPSVKNPSAASEGRRTPVAISTPEDRLAQARIEIAKLLKISNATQRGYKIYDYIHSLDAETVKALLGDLANSPLDMQHGNEEFLSLMGRWGEVDPSAALNWAENLRDPRMKKFGIDQIFDAWSTQNPSVAFAALSQLKGFGTSDRTLMMTVMQNYARQDPQAALSALSSLPAGQLSELYPNMFRVWASDDPAAAATAALKLPPSSTRSSTLSAIASVWATQDPKGALAWVNTLPAGPAQNNALNSALQAVSIVDPASAASYAVQFNLTASSAGNNLFYNIASNWALQDPTGLLTWADNNLTGSNYNIATTVALQQMSSSDPAATAKALAQVSDASIVNQIAPQLATTWAKQDPQAALAWAQSLPLENVSLRNSAIAGALNAWTTSDPASSGNYILQNFATDPSFGTLATQVVSSWANSDPQAALNWAESLPQGVAQNSAVVAAIDSLAKVDPQTAWSDAQQLAENQGVNAEVSVISAWASQQPAQAAAALSDIPPGSNLNTATADVAKSWLAQDPNAASQWINTLPQGSARDAAVTQLISNAGKNDPASAFSWAVSISDEATRNVQVTKLVTQWSNQNPTAAATAAQNVLTNLTGLTATQQSALQKVVDQASPH